MNLNGEVQMYAGALIIVTIIAIAIGISAIITIKTLSEEKVPPDSTTEDEVIAFDAPETTKASQTTSVSNINSDNES